MKKPITYIAWFKDISRKDEKLVGGKGANLGEMTTMGAPVPNGFVVTTDAYRSFLEANDLERQIKNNTKKLDLRNSSQIASASQKISQVFENAKVPKNISDAIKLAYKKLAPKDQEVAVRSSATAEDSLDASFAGQLATFLNIEGEQSVIEAVKKCWASHFTPRAFFYRAEKGYDHFTIDIAVPIQLMVQSEVSGVMFTTNPINSDQDCLIIESVWGLGEMIVEGNLSPDHYEVRKSTHSITKREISPQEKKLVKVGSKNKLIDIEKSKISSQKIADSVIVRIAKLGMRLERHYGHPQDVEWAYQNGKIHIIQTRPITAMYSAESIGQIETINEKNEKPILSGKGVSPGVVSGRVNVIKSPTQSDLMGEGDILVTPATTPDFIQIMRKAKAIVTDHGSQSSHTAIISRELGIPCIVGTANATTKLKQNQLVTVDANKGHIFDGAITLKHTKLTLPQGATSIRDIKTETKVFVNLSEPELARPIAQKYVDGVGLLRAETIISEYIGLHPAHVLKTGRKRFFIDKLAESLAEFCQEFGKRPVIYRASDFKTDEYKLLDGGEKYEVDEKNPVIGFRGSHRYLMEEEAFLMEVEAIRKVREKFKHKNLHLMIPFVRTTNELKDIKHLLAQNGLIRRHNFKLYMMVETPNNVFLLDEFIDIGIDGISIGSNDLAMLILGYDRENEKIAHIYNEMDQGMQKAIEIVIRTCKKRGITSSICGQAPSMYPEIIKDLVDWGITSISVSPDMIDKTRLIIEMAESNQSSKKSTLQKLFG